MEMNAESVLDALNDFERKPSEVPPILDEYLLRVAQNGEIVFPWNKLKPLLKRKLEIVLDEFHETCPVEITVPVPNFQTFNYESLKSTILTAVDAFNSAPFTIQRICELITNPKKHYNRTDKYMRGIEKNVLVVSTIEPRIGVQNDANANVNPIVNGMIGDSPHGDDDCFNGHENNENEQTNNLNSPTSHVLLDNFANVFPSAACIPSPSNICINRDVETISRVDNNFLPASECVESQEIGFEGSLSMDTEISVEESNKEEQMDTTSEETTDDSASEISKEDCESSAESETQSAVVESSEPTAAENEEDELEAEKCVKKPRIEENFETSVIKTDIASILESGNDASSSDDASKADSISPEVPLPDTDSVSADTKPAEPQEQCQQDDTVSQTDDCVNNDLSKVSVSDEIMHEASEAVEIKEVENALPKEELIEVSQSVDKCKEVSDQCEELTSTADESTK